MTRLDLNLPGSPPDHRIVVAMSGGVDSSVTAALLVEHGFEVVGITLQLYDHGTAIGRKGACCAGRDIGDAASVADRLGIAHYVRRMVGPDGPELHRARDKARDQSYFLFATTRAELDFLRFPLGSLTKEETRAVARRFGLAVADKPDSQDICFVPQGSYARVVERLRPEAGEPGDIVDMTGHILGRHHGIAHFTVGQRKGLGIAAPEPLYVLRLDPEARRVVVGPRAALATTRVPLGELNWLGPKPAPGVAVMAKLRSTQLPVPARFYAGDGTSDASLVLDAPAGAVAPGQAAVLYRGERVLGGGWIRRRAAAPA